MKKNVYYGYEEFPERAFEGGVPGFHSLRRIPEKSSHAKKLRPGLHTSGRAAFGDFHSAPGLSASMQRIKLLYTQYFAGIPACLVRLCDSLSLWRIALCHRVCRDFDRAHEEEIDSNNISMEAA